MAKKEDLKKIVRGKGLDALRPTAEDSSPDSNDNPQEKTEQTLITNNVGEQMGQEDKLNKHCLITEILLSPEQQAYFKDKLGENTHQILIWDTFVSQGEHRGTVFRNDAPLNFNVCCVASGLLAQLKPELEIQWTTYDIQRMQLQPLYDFKIKTKPSWPIFKISYEVQPALAGYFKFNVIVDIEQIELFWIKEGFVFKINNSN